MYMEHDPGDGHKAWKEKIEENKSHRKKVTSATFITPTASSEGIYDRRQLKLSEKLQASMMTDLKFYKNKVDCLMTAYNSDF